MRECVQAKRGEEARRVLETRIDALGQEMDRHRRARGGGGVGKSENNEARSGRGGLYWEGWDWRGRVQCAGRPSAGRGAGAASRAGAELTPTSLPRGEREIG